MKNYYYITPLIGCLWINSACAFSMDDINSWTCEPSGIFNNIKKNVKPRELWEEYTWEISYIVKNWSETMRGVCADSGRTKQECDATSRQSLEVWSRCLRHAVQECVKHGGGCTVA